MMSLLTIENVNTGIGLTAVPLIIIGVVVVALVVGFFVWSNISKKKKEAAKAARKAAKAAQNKEQDSDPHDKDK